MLSWRRLKGLEAEAVLAQWRGLRQRVATPGTARYAEFAKPLTRAQIFWQRFVRETRRLLRPLVRRSPALERW